MSREVTAMGIEFEFVKDRDTCFMRREIEPNNTSLEEAIESMAHRLALNLGTGWEYDDYTVAYCDPQWAHAHEFVRLNAYGKYICNVKRFGVAYHLRSKDACAEFDFEDEFVGCWKSEVEFFDDCILDYDLPDCIKRCLSIHKWLESFCIYEHEGLIYVFSP